MNLRQLRYFVEVARSGHYGQAARTLAVAQPAVSRAIQALEEELGVVLFERLPRGVRLSPAGQRYRSEIEKILADLVYAAKIAKGESNATREPLKAGQAPMKTMEREADYIWERFISKNVQYQVNVRQLGSRAQVEALTERAIDLGLGHVCGSLPGALRSQRIVENPYCGARVGLGHPLAGAESIRFRDIRDQPLLMFHRDLNPILFDEVTSALKARGFCGELVQNAEFTIWNWKTIPRHKGWMLANKNSMHVVIEDTIGVPFDDLSLPFGIDALWNDRHRTDGIDAFLSCFTPHTRH
jgi:DNA-binding transcriptional LysR family regulator